MKHLLGVALLAVVATTSAARPRDRDVSLLQFGRAGWTWVPITENGVVDSFVGLRTGASEGDNITAVWFRRSSGEGWDSWAWREQDQSTAIASVISVLALPASTDAGWPVAPSSSTGSSPARLQKGVLDTDPFAPIIASLEDPAPFVQALESSGWSAAWLDLWEYECEDRRVLDAWARAIEIEDTVAEVEQRIDQLALERGCTTTTVRQEIWCWVDRYWTSMDAGSPLSFDGTGLGIQRDWHPFDEAVQAFEAINPGVPIGEAVYGGAWHALSPDERGEFRSLTLILEYESFLGGKVRALGSPASRPNEPAAPAGTADCDHGAFYALMRALMEEMAWGRGTVAACLYPDGQDEGWIDCLTNRPVFDCDDFADTIGSCLLRQLSEAGHDVLGRNKKVILKCPGTRGAGHTIFGIFYCGYWYIIDGSALEHPIGIVPGMPDGPFPIDGGVAAWLGWRYLESACVGFGVIPEGEWMPGERPWHEPDPWFSSPAEAIRVVDCLRGAGLPAEAVAAALECAVPVDQLQQLLQWIANPPSPPPAGIGGGCHPVCH